eukprot:1964600-Rhodomonas_salina.1
MSGMVLHPLPLTASTRRCHGDVRGSEKGEGRYNVPPIFTLKCNDSAFCGIDQENRGMVALQLVPVVMSGNGENRCCRGLRQLRACLVRRVPFSNWKIFKLLVSYFEAVLRAFLFSSER